MASLYDMTVPMFVHALRALDGILKKAEEHAKDNNTPPSDLIEGRLAADMRPLPFQIQSACDTAKFLTIRVGGAANVPQEDNETTFDQLHARIATTLDILDKFERKDLDGKQDSEVDLRGRKLTGLTYCTQYAIPNFFFHVSTAYAILRSKGVPIGKADYLASLAQQKA